MVEPNGLEDLQALVGGPIEGLPHSEEILGYVHEEGKLEALPENHMATFAYAQVLARGDRIVGPCVLVGIDPETHEEVDAPDRVLVLANAEAAK